VLLLLFLASWLVSATPREVHLSQQPPQHKNQLQLFLTPHLLLA
jgi:hypothetical protein